MGQAQSPHGRKRQPEDVEEKVKVQKNQETNPILAIFHLLLTLSCCGVSCNEEKQWTPDPGKDRRSTDKKRRLRKSRTSVQPKTPVMEISTTPELSSQRLFSRPHSCTLYYSSDSSSSRCSSPLHLPPPLPGVPFLFFPRKKMDKPAVDRQDSDRSDISLSEELSSRDLTWDYSSFGTFLSDEAKHPDEENQAGSNIYSLATVRRTDEDAAEQSQDQNFSRPTNS
ncbi:hypothetical protein DPEC_G00085060 [Dallia pectoralis]|uniref:Uncharacterized protein n=1 Tax=Dallia pectoralis TaxID=75939 RepID=A0ACC2H016_DALPE|nr:hypothetical protein DPEC_G00085060 [Dallia pectoralis]